MLAVLNLRLSDLGALFAVPLHSYRRSSLSHKLSRSAASSASGHAAPPTPSNELASVNLRLSFSPPASPSSSNASQAASQLSQLSSAFSNADFDFHSLASSAPSTSALQALISRAMSKIASKIVICFPLCFNARWIEVSFPFPSALLARRS